MSTTTKKPKSPIAKATSWCIRICLAIGVIFLFKECGNAPQEQDPAPSSGVSSVTPVVTQQKYDFKSYTNLHVGDAQSGVHYVGLVTDYSGDILLDCVVDGERSITTIKWDGTGNGTWVTSYPDRGFFAGKDSGTLKAVKTASSTQIWQIDLYLNGQLVDNGVVVPVT